MLELSIILVLGLVTGILVGLLPGLPAYVGPLILFPFIQDMTVEQILTFWLACQIGSQYFGSVAAILLKVPGEASSIVFIEDLNKLSMNDRYDLVRQTAWGSTIGSLISLGLLLLVFYFGLSEHLIKLTNINTKLTVLTILAITLIYFTKHRLVSAGLFAIGLFFSEKSNQTLPNWIFDMQTYTTDVTVFSLILGAMIIPEFLQEIFAPIEKDPIDLKLSKQALQPKLDIKSMLRGTWLGSLIGFIPGPSTILASVFTYNSQNKDDIKKRIISSEAANNSAAVTSLLPFLFIGLPITLSEMIVSDIMHIKFFTIPNDLVHESIFSGVSLIEFCFIIVGVCTLVYHVLAQRFLVFYERLMELAYGKLSWIYLLLVVYLINIDTHFNPVYMPRYLVFMAVLTGLGMWMLKKRISALPLVFGFILGDVFAWTIFNFYRINFY